MRACLAWLVGAATVAALGGTALAQSTDDWGEDVREDDLTRYRAPSAGGTVLDGTFDRENTGDDWFYDAYVQDEDAVYRPYTYDYDWDDDRFDWEEGRAGAYAERGSDRRMKDRMHQSRAVSGEILTTKRVAAPDGRSDHLVALVATDRGNARLIIDFGAIDRLDRFERQVLRRGEQISAEGPVKVVGGVNVLKAKRVSAGDDTFRIDRPAMQRQQPPKQRQQPHHMQPQEPRDPYEDDD